LLVALTNFPLIDVFEKITWAHSVDILQIEVTGYEIFLHPSILDSYFEIVIYQQRSSQYRCHGVGVLNFYAHIVIFFPFIWGSHSWCFQ